MLDAARRLSSVRILQDSFLFAKKRDMIHQRQALIIGRMLCLIFFSFRYELQSDKSDPEGEVEKQL